jgi:hypothetical protein
MMRGATWIREHGWHQLGRRSGRFGVLPNRTHLRRGDRREGHLPNVPHRRPRTR